MPKTNVTEQMTTHTLSLSYELLQVILRHKSNDNEFIYLDRFIIARFFSLLRAVFEILIKLLFCDIQSWLSISTMIQN